MLKTYQSKTFISRSINIDVDGKKRVISFIGGVVYPRKVCGFYTTSDPKEQKALESHPGFGSKFILITEEKKDVKQVEPITLLEQQETTEEINDVVDDLPEDAETTVDTEENSKEENDATEEHIEEEQTEETTVNHDVVEVLEVEKVQEAKDYLMNKFPGEFTHRQLANKEMILNAAKERNITFPNIL